MAGETMMYVSAASPHLDTVEVDSPIGAVFFDSPTQLANFRRRLDSVEQVALNPNKSRDLVFEIANDLQGVLPCPSRSGASPRTPRRRVMPASRWPRAALSLPYATPSARNSPGSRWAERRGRGSLELFERGSCGGSRRQAGRDLGVRWGSPGPRLSSPRQRATVASCTWSV